MLRHPEPVSRRIADISRLLIVCVLVFASGSAAAYGGYHGKGYRHYGHHYGFQYKHHGHHGGSDAAGYLVLGLIGGAILTSIFYQSQIDRHRYYDYPRGRYYRTYEQPVPRQPKPPAYRIYKRTTPPAAYNNYEGWDWLARGYADKAMDIFAIQSQQDLAAGTPRVGFAIAAAVNGERERGNRAMRKALATDPESLRYIRITRELEPVIDALSADYQLALADNGRRLDESFMFAVLSYLKKDYNTADRVISDAIVEGDYSQSSRNLKHLIDKELGNT